MTDKLKVSVVVDGPDSAGWYDVRVNGVAPFDSESREDAEEYAARLRVALRECGDSMIRSPLDYCMAHLATDLNTTDGGCDQAEMFSTPCVLVPLYRKAEQQ